MLSLNPYIAGNPVGGTPNFVGRADVLREVLRVMRQPHQNIIVLYGQRRIGKTSVLQQLAAQLPNEGDYYPVYFDLQDKASWTLGRVLTDLARAMSYELTRQGSGSMKPTGPLLNDADPVKAFQETWLPATLNRLPEGHSIVLLFDEFDVLADPKGGQAGADLFPYLRGLLATDPTRLQFAFVIGRKVEDLESIALSLFKGAPALRVSLLNKADTFELVRLSERNETLRWSNDALEKVWDLTHGHPFLTQQLCSRLWENLYESDPTGTPTVLPEDVEDAIPETLEASRNTLEWLWDGLPPAERVVISALAGAGNRAITRPQLEQLLRESGVRVVIRELQNAPQLLQDWDLIEPADEGYRFRVELFRRWILEHKPLSRVQEELDRIEPLAENLYQAAYGFFRTNQLEDAMPLLRQAIGLNPNHARSRQLLAEIFLLRGEVDQAVQILQLLYDTQPAIARPRLVQALILKAEEEAEDEKRQGIYQQILLIDPSHPIASQRVAEYQKLARQQELAYLLEDLLKTEKEKRYRDALEVARKLAEKYPDERDWQPDLDRLERKTKLAEDYQRAIGALNSADRETALRGLADVIALEPDYEEATRYLHLAKTGQDAAQLASQLIGEQKAHNKVLAELRDEVAAHTEAEKRRDELQIRLESEQQHMESYRRMSRRMLYWSIGSSFLAVAFFLAWFVRGVFNDTDRTATQTAIAQTAVAQYQMTETMSASATPPLTTETPMETADVVTDLPPEDTVAPTDTPGIIETLVLTDTETPVPTPTPNPFAGPVPEAAYARLGKGSILSAALSPDGQWVAVGTTVGLFMYQANTFEEVWYIVIREGVFSLAFSSDSTRIAIGNFKIEVWDVETGALWLPFESSDGLEINNIAFSPDGDMLASSGSASGIILWDAESGSIIRTLEGDGSNITSLAFSPEENLLAAGMQSGAVSTWNIDNEFAQTDLGNHDNTVLSLAFSPDGRRLASGGEGSQIIVWDVVGQTQTDDFQSITTEEAVHSLAFSEASENILASGLASGDIVVWDWTDWTVQQTISAHSERVIALAFYADETLFSASEDNSATHTDWVANDVAQRLEGFTAPIISTAYSSDGILAVGYNNGDIRLWNTETNEPTSPFNFDGSAVNALAFSPSNEDLLAAGYGNHQVVLWNIVTGGEDELGSHSAWVTDVAFSPNGTLLASASQDGTFIVWNIETKEQEFNSGTAHADQVNTVAFSPDADRFASGSKDGQIILWNVADWSQTDTFSSTPGSSVESLAFSQNGAFLAAGSSDNTIVVRELTTQVTLPALIYHGSTVSSVAFSPTESTLLASGSLDSDVVLWDVTTGESKFILAGHTELISNLSFSPDGSVLASGSGDGTVVLWDTNPQQLFKLSSDHGKVNEIAFSAQGNILASAAQDGTITLWNMNSGTISTTLTGPAEALSVAFSPLENHVLAAGFGDGEILLWNLNNLDEEPRPLSGHADAVYALAFSSDGRLLASGSADTNVIIWNISETTTPPRVLEEHDSTIYSLAFSPDGTTLASGSRGGNILLWNVAFSRFLNALSDGGHTAEVFGLVFLNDTFLVSASEDKKLILWNVSSNQKNEEIGEETNGILSLDFDMTHTFLATGNRDGQVNLWPIANDEPIVLTEHTEEVYAVAFSPDGQILASASEDGTIILWELANILP